MLINVFINESRCELFDAYPISSAMLISNNYSTVIFRPTNASFQSVVTSTSTSVLSTITSILALGSTCSTTVSGGSILANFSGQSRSSNYENYTFSFQAPSSTTKILFSFSAHHNKGWYLDDVSVRNANGDELILNGNFSTSNLTNWTELCSMNCSGPATRNTSGVTNSCGSGSSTPCYYGECDPPTYIFLLQSVSTLSGHVYTLRFLLAVKSSEANSVFITSIA
ncbi:unnamed protein product [Adineta ricciae]|nr:unnamed protein product [Adineta ricciae]